MAELDLLIGGGGRMGEALPAGLPAAGRPALTVGVVEVAPVRREELAAAHPSVAIHAAPVPAQAAVIAVKPGDVAGACAAVAAAARRSRELGG